MSAAYYNEIDDFAAEWLRRLILFGHIAPGDVDGRDIRDVSPDDLRGYEQHHFFAGIGVWSYAARLAGWPDDRPLASGSCPCQPFSAAGGRSGFADERHLWPAFYHIIRERRFPVVVGEQVASKDGLAWLDLVSADMEGAHYTGGAVDLCSAGFGAPHIRQRLNFVWLDNAERERRGPWRRDHSGHDRAEPRAAGTALGLVDVQQQGLEGQSRHVDGAGRRAAPARSATASSGAGGMVDADVSGQHAGAPGGQQPLCDERDECHECHEGTALRDPGPVNGFWRDADWLYCRNPAGEPSWRAVRPGSFPLAHGVAARMGLLRGYGNAVNAQVTAGFLEAVMECRP